MGWWDVRYACPARSMISLWQRQAKRNLKNKRVVGIIVNLRLQSCTSQHERTFSNCWHICIRDVSMQYRKNCLQQTLHTLCWYRACCFRSIIQRNMQRKFVPCIRNWAHHCKSSPHKNCSLLTITPGLLPACSCPDYGPKSKNTISPCFGLYITTLPFRQENPSQILQLYIRYPYPLWISPFLNCCPHKTISFLIGWYIHCQRLYTKKKNLFVAAMLLDGCLAARCKTPWIITPFFHDFIAILLCIRVSWFSCYTQFQPLIQDRQILFPAQISPESVRHISST